MHENILASFLSKKVTTTFLGILLIILLILLGNNFFVVAKESLKIGLNVNEFLPFISWKILRDLPLILGFSFSLSILITFHQINKNSEKIILNSSGLNNENILMLISKPLMGIFFLIIICAFYISPLANKQISITKEIGQDRPDYFFLRDAQFMKFDEYIFYAKQIDGPSESQDLIDVYLFSKDKEFRTIVTASNGKKIIDGEKIFLFLKNGKIYKNIEKNGIAEVSNFQEYQVNLNNSNKSYDSIQDEGSSSFHSLFKLSTKKAYSEIFYRLSQPISLLILSFLFVNMSGRNPRRSNNLNIILGVLLYFAYFNLILIVKSRIELDILINSYEFLMPHLLFILILFFVKYTKITNKI